MKKVLITGFTSQEGSGLQVKLGAQSRVAVSFAAPEYTADVDALGTPRLLEALRLLGL